MLEQFPKDVKLVTKNFPLRSHRFAVRAAVAALAAHRQGKFETFHEQLMANQKDLSEVKLQEIATALGLDMEKFQRDLSDPALQRIISRDFNDGRRAGVKGIPTVFINGKNLKNRSLSGFRQMVEAELKRK